MKKTKIECFTHSWNPIDGCKYNCGYCYARTIARRFGGHKGLDYYMAQEKSSETGENHVLLEPMRDEVTGKAEAYPFGFDPTFCTYRLPDPAEHKVPSNVFVCSMGDMFGPWIPDLWIREVFKSASAASWHNYLFLSKNPSRYNDIAQCADNFFFGTTITDKKSLGNLTKNMPRHLRFLSIEPIHEMLELYSSIEKLAHQIEWIIVGAENGNRQGKVLPQAEWIEDVSAACKRAGIPLFMKRGQKSRDGTFALEEYGGASFRQEYPKSLDSIRLLHDESRKNNPQTSNKIAL